MDFQSTEGEKEANSAGNEPSKRPGDIYDDLLELVRQLGLPKELPEGARTRDYQRRAIGPAVAWGWLVRVARTGAAAVNLERIGFGAETAPLTRSAIEHAIRLLWAKDHGDQFVEVALISQQEGLSRVLKAQKMAWTFNPELADKIEERMSEASAEYRGLSHLAHLRAIVDLNLAERGPLYMGWLLDTQESHPSIASAQPYYDVQEDGDNITLRLTSKFTTAAATKACFALIAALHAYGTITGDIEDLEPKIQAAVKLLMDSVDNVDT